MNYSRWRPIIVFGEIGEIGGFGRNDGGSEGNVEKRWISGDLLSLDAHRSGKSAEILIAGFQTLLQVDQSVDADYHFADKVYFRHAEPEERLEVLIDILAQTDRPIW